MTYRHLTLFATFSLTACLSPQTREGYIDDATYQVCAAEAACGDVGEGEDYASMEDCYDDVESVFRLAWPDGRCDVDRISDAAYDLCIADAEEAACEDDPFDTLDAIDACRAGRVCTD